MAVEGGDLARCHDQQVVVIGRKLAQGRKLRGRVVVAHRHEIEAAGHGGLQGLEHRARDPGALARGAGPVAVAGMHVQVAAPPALAPFDGLCAEARGRGASPIQPDPGDIVGAGVLADVRRAEDQPPFPRRHGAGQVGGRGVAGRDREARLVPTAPAPQTLRIAQAKVDDRLLLRAGIGELDRDALCSHRDLERQLPIGLVRRPGQDAGQGQVGRALLRLGAQRERQESECGERRSQALPQRADHRSGLARPSPNAEKQPTLRCGDCGRGKGLIFTS